MVTVRGILPEEVGEATGLAAVRAATPADGVVGVVPSVVAQVSNVEEVSRLLAWANERGLKVVPCGARTKLDRGAPPTRCDILLDLRNLSATVEHAAGDMTVTVQAGITLPDLQSALAGAGQFLAVDPQIPGTVGGLIASGDTGPRRIRYGGVRDLLLGVTFVRADGVVARGGGKVVKNVAGYDLPKLMAGSLGTLGVIVEATFRLYPLPQASLTVAAQGLTASEAGEAVAAILGSTLVPTSIDYSGGREGKPILAVRFETSPRSAEAQAARTVRLLGGQTARILVGDEEIALWQRFDGIVDTEREDVLAKLVSTVTDLPRLLESTHRSAKGADVKLSFRAHLGNGHALVRWHEPKAETIVPVLNALRAEAEERGSNLIVWRAPDDVRANFDVWGDPGDGLGLMRRIKEQFDPRRTLNPGRFVGGI